MTKKNMEKIAMNEQHHTDKYFNKGKLLYELGKFQDAIKYFDIAIRKDSSNVDAYEYKGECLNYLGNYEDAKRCAEKAIKKEGSEYASALSLKAESLSYLGRANEAVKAAEEAFKLSDTSSDKCYALFVKGYSLQYMGEYQEALKHIEYAIEICKGDEAVEAWITKGIILNQLKPPKDKDMDNQLENYEAIKCFDNAIKMSSKKNLECKI